MMISKLSFIEEETQLLMEHLADEEAWSLTFMAGAYCRPEFDQLKKEAQIYFTPTFLPGIPLTVVM